MTDQHEGERVAVAAVTRAFAGECGENAADKGAESGSMRLDEDCGGRGRVLLALRGTAHAIQAAVRLCAEYLFSSGWSERVWITADHEIACGNLLTELRSGGRQVGRLRRPERAGGPTHADVHARRERRSPLETIEWK